MIRAGALLWLGVMLMTPVAHGANATTAEAAIDPAKIEAIRELLEVTGAEANHEQLTQNFAQQMITVLEANNLPVTDRIRAMIREEVDRFIRDQLDREILQQKMYRVYARYFSLAELEGLIAFNKTEIGRKANRVMPILMRESMTAAQSWSVEIGPELSARVKQRLADEGIKLSNNR